jgi:hypothetical protein
VRYRIKLPPVWVVKWGCDILFLYFCTRWPNQYTACRDHISGMVLIYRAMTGHISGTNSHISVTDSHISDTESHTSGTDSHISGMGSHILGTAGHISGASHISGPGSHISGTESHISGHWQSHIYIYIECG